VLLPSVRLANMATQSYDISMRKSCVGIRVSARSCGPGKRVDTWSVIHSLPRHVQSPLRSSSLQIVAFIFMINIKGNKKCFTERCRCGHLGKVSRLVLIKSGVCCGLNLPPKREFCNFFNINYTKVNARLFYC
jgi:hypothetical protein